MLNIMKNGQSGRYPEKSVKLEKYMSVCILNNKISLFINIKIYFSRLENMNPHLDHANQTTTNISKQNVNFGRLI